VLEARLAEAERQLQAAKAGDCNVHCCLVAATSLELGPTTVALQPLVDGSAIASQVEEPDACEAHSLVMPAKEAEQPVQQQSSLIECQREVVNSGSLREDLLTTDPHKSEQQNLQANSCDTKPLCSSSGVHHRLRCWVLAMLGIVLLVCGSLCTLGFSESLAPDTDMDMMTCSDPSSEAGFLIDQWLGQPQE